MLIKKIITIISFSLLLFTFNSNAASYGWQTPYGLLWTISSDANGDYLLISSGSNPSTPVPQPLYIYAKDVSAAKFALYVNFVNSWFQNGGVKFSLFVDYTANAYGTGKAKINSIIFAGK